MSVSSQIWPFAYYLINLSPFLLMYFWGSISIKCPRRWNIILQSYSHSGQDCSFKFLWLLFWILNTNFGVPVDIFVFQVAVYPMASTATMDHFQCFTPLWETRLPSQLLRRLCFKRLKRKNQNKWKVHQPRHLKQVLCTNGRIWPAVNCMIDYAAKSLFTSSCLWRTDFTISF